VGYYQRNRPYMRYNEYPAWGWPIGTRMVKGACGHLVKDRLEQSGMRWTNVGAQAVLDLRAVGCRTLVEWVWALRPQRRIPLEIIRRPAALVAVPKDGDVARDAARGQEIVIAAACKIGCPLRIAPICGALGLPHDTYCRHQRRP
jgi:hypothetical protein